MKSQPEHVPFSSPSRRKRPCRGNGIRQGGVGHPRGPSELNFDFSLLKDFPIHKIRDSANLQSRVEFFNNFNLPLFEHPDTSFTDPSFGQIANTYGNFSSL